MKSQSSPRRASTFELTFIFLFFAFFAAIVLLSPRASAQDERLRDLERIAAARAATTVEQEQIPSKSIVRGRALYDDTGRPVRRAPILLLPATGRNEGGGSSGMTNARGEFQVRNVRAGSYFVMVNAPGVITPVSFVDLRELSAGPDGMNLAEVRKHFEEVTVDGMNTVDIEVRAKRGGAISGRVSYADGNPAISVNISVMRKKDNRAALFISNISAAALYGLRTDDRGVFRVSGLPPGEYLISASETVIHGNSENNREVMDLGMFGLGGGDPLAVTYYQGATSQKEATAIRVEAGSEASDINLTLVERPTFRLRGVVRAKRGGIPLVGARINFSRKDAEETTMMSHMREMDTARTDEQGRFTLIEIPDGTYTITVEPPYSLGEEMMGDYGGNMNMNGNVVRPDVAIVTNNNSPNMSQQPRERRPRYVRKQQEVTVAGGDVTSIVVELSQGGSISGTVVFENGKPLSRVIGITVQAEQTGEEQSPDGGNSGYVSPGDDQFTIESLPAGNFYLGARVASHGGQGEQSGSLYYAKAISLNNTDLTRDSVALREGGAVTGVRIVLAADAATLNGRIVASGEEKRVLSNKLVLIVPADANKRRRRSSHTYESTDAKGAFTAQLPPGEYLIILLPEGAARSGLLLSDEAINKEPAGATRVTLNSNERKNLEITAPGEN